MYPQNMYPQNTPPRRRRRRWSMSRVRVFSLGLIAIVATLALLFTGNAARPEYAVYLIAGGVVVCLVCFVLPR